MFPTIKVLRRTRREFGQLRQTVLFILLTCDALTTRHGPVHVPDPISSTLQDVVRVGRDFSIDGQWFDPDFVVSVKHVDPNTIQDVSSKMKRILLVWDEGPTTQKIGEVAIDVVYGAKSEFGQWYRSYNANIFYGTETEGATSTAFLGCTSFSAADQAYAQLRRYVEHNQLAWHVHRHERSVRTVAGVSDMIEVQLCGANRALHTGREGRASRSN